MLKSVPKFAILPQNPFDTTQYENAGEKLFVILQELVTLLSLHNLWKRIS